MDAPQSPADVRPVEQALQQLDALLTIRWNPHAYLCTPGSYDVYGHLIPARYDGRWQVVRNGEVVYTLAWDGEGQKAYRPVGWWLVDFMRQWDAANRNVLAEIQKMRDAETAERETADRRAAEERNERFAKQTRDTMGGEREQFTGF